MIARLDLALAVTAGLVAGPLMAQPLQPVPAVPAAPSPPPRLQPLTEGTLPIVPCPEHADRGCVEVLFDGDQPPLACWTLPPFGNAGVRVETAPAQQVGNSATRRMTILFHPLDRVPPAMHATLHFGFPRPDAPLVCDQEVSVQRPSGVLALPGDLDLGVLHVDLFGRVAGAGLVQPIFPAPGQPAPGQPAIGPLAVSSQASLHAGDRRGSPIPVRLELPGNNIVTASRIAELRLTPVAAQAFPALGALSAQGWVTAPQLVQPLPLTIRASSRIGWLSILTMLVLGIVAGAIVHRYIVPRQALALARLDGERALVAAAASRDDQRDADLARELGDLIDQTRQQLGAARDPAAILQTVQGMNQSLSTRLQAADSSRQALAARIVPALSALRALPAVSELPMQTLDAWTAVLEKAQAMIESGEITRPQRLIETEVATAEHASLVALTDFADHARVAIHGLERWTRDASVQAFGPLQAAGTGFVRPLDGTPVSAVTALRDAHHALRQAVAAGYSSAALVLRAQAAGAANSGFANAPERTEAILRDLDRIPVAALTRLSALVDDYERHRQTSGLASFEDLADVKPSGAEGGAVPILPVERRIELPDPPELAIETEPRLPVAGRDLTIRLTDLPAGHVARIWTPLGSARISGRDDPVLTIRPGHAGVIPVQIVLADAGGRVLSRQSTTLTVQSAPDHAIPALTTELRRADRLAVAAAAALALLSGIAVFSVVPLTSWWALLAPLLWGFFVNLNLPEAIQGLQAQRDAVFQSLKLG